jgi:hypothetical protein
MVTGRLGRESAAIDVDTGGAEVFAWALEHASACPPVLAAAERYAANVYRAVAASATLVSELCA